MNSKRFDLSNAANIISLKTVKTLGLALGLAGLSLIIHTPKAEAYITQVTMDTNNWNRTQYYRYTTTIDNTPNPPTVTSDGITFSSTQYRAGVYLNSNYSYNLSDATLFVKWRVQTNNYMGMGLWLTPGGYQSGFETASASGTETLTTDHSWNGSYTLQSDTWYYSRLTISNNTFFSSVSQGNYDTQGGNQLISSNGSLTSAQQSWLTHAYISTGLWDNYQTNASMTVGEVTINSAAVPWEISPNLSIGLGLPLFLGLRTLKKRLPLKK